jgi:site-specific DNA recombinase
MRIALYVRVSSDRQAQTQTIEQQIERLKAHCHQQGWQIREEQIFRDDGYSGASLKRPALDRLRDQVNQAAFDRIILTAPDRLARKYVHQMLLIEEFEKYGCQVEFVDRPMSNDPHDQLLLQIRGAVSEYERNLIVERTRRGRLQKYKAGTLLPWTRPPYGYQLNPDHPRDPGGVRTDENTAWVVTEIFRRYGEESTSLQGLAKQLMREGISSPWGNSRWNMATLGGILTNPSYTGTVYAGRHRSKPREGRQSPLKPIGKRGESHTTTPPEDWLAVCSIPALVPKEQFEVVKLKLAQNQSFATRHNTSHTYLLRALVSCGECRTACIARTQGKYSYYTCRAKSHPVVSARDAVCHARFIPAGQVDELVWQDLCQVLQQPQMIERALQRAQCGEWLPQELATRRESLRRAKVSLANQLERLTEAYLAQVLNLEEFKRRRADLEGRVESLAVQLHQLDHSVNRQKELSGLVDSVTAFCAKVQSSLTEASFEQKRQLIELLIDRVVVKAEEVEIRYVIPTSPKSEKVRFCLLRSDYFDLPTPKIPLDDS